MLPAQQNIPGHATKTFQDVGVRAAKSMAKHLLLENAYSDNLLYHVSKVDYLVGNQGRTHLEPLLDLPAFFDDLYVFGYLSGEDCVLKQGMLFRTSGKDGVAKSLVSSIGIALQTAMGRSGKFCLWRFCIQFLPGERPAATFALHCKEIPTVERGTNGSRYIQENLCGDSL